MGKRKLIQPSVLTPQPDGVTTIFSVGEPYEASSLEVYRDGVQLDIVSSNGYTETSPGVGTFTMKVVLRSGQILSAVIIDTSPDVGGNTVELTGQLSISRPLNGSIGVQVLSGTLKVNT